MYETLHEQLQLLAEADGAFPTVNAPFPGLPLSPPAKVHKILSKHREIVHKASWNMLDRNSETDVEDLFRWARETLDFVESTGHRDIDPGIVKAAVDIIVVISQCGCGANGIITKYTGASNYSIGLWYLFGLFDHRKDASIAVSYFRLSAEQGHSRALYRIGNIYERLGGSGKDGDSSIASAVSFYEQGAEAGDAACLYRLGMAHLRGQLGLRVNIGHAMRTLKHASKISDPDCSHVSYIYGLLLCGNLKIGTDQDSSYEFTAQLSRYNDPRGGVSAIERAAWMGYSPALVWMARAYAGRERGSHCAISMRYLHLAAYQAVHRRYLHNMGVKPRGTLLAANIRGVPEAEIAKWFLCGQPGVLDANPELAYKFACVSAHEENSIGQFALGFFAESGLVGAPDVGMAKKWYKIAASNGNVDARRHLELVMSPELRPRLSQSVLSQKPVVPQPVVQQEPQHVLQEPQPVLQEVEYVQKKSSVDSFNTITPSICRNQQRHVSAPISQSYTKVPNRPQSVYLDKTKIKRAIFDTPRLRATLARKEEDKKEKEQKREQRKEEKEQRKEEKEQKKEQKREEKQRKKEEKKKEEEECPSLPPLELGDFDVASMISETYGSEGTVVPSNDSSTTLVCYNEDQVKLTPNTLSELEFGDFDKNGPMLSKWPSNMTLNKARSRLLRRSNESIKSTSSYKSALSRVSSCQSMYSAKSTWSVESVELGNSGKDKVPLTFDDMNVPVKEELEGDCKVM